MTAVTNPPQAPQCCQSTLHADACGQVSAPSQQQGSAPHEITTIGERRRQFSEMQPIAACPVGAGFPSGDSITFSFERAYAKGPVEPKVIAFFDRLRPHLARSSLLAARLGLENARAMTQALADVGLPAAVLRGPGLLYAANPLFEALMPELCHDRQARLTFSDPTVDRLFADGLDVLARSIIVGAQKVCSIPVPAHNDRVPMIVHLLPVRRAARDVFSQATTLVVITPVDRGAVPNAELIAGLFDLTPAEARVARGVAGGLTLDAIGNSAGVSRETVRSQLKAVLNKTGVSRQAELTALLAGLTLPPSD